MTVWGHGCTKFVLEECGSGECPTSLIPEAMIAKPSMKLAMIAKPNIEKVVEGYRNSQLWLMRAIPGKVIDRRNTAEEIWYGHVPRHIPSVAVW